jgi:O-antigen/teichoic acid export membrane protein
VLFDQGVASASNFLLVALVGRWLGPAALGSLALVLAVWAIVYGVFRAVVEDPMVVLGEADGVGQHLAAGLIVAGTGMGGLAILCGALTVLGHDAATTAALALSLPFLLIQDFWRRVAYMRGQPSRAVSNDLVYLCIQVALVVGLRVTGRFEASTALLAWGAGAGAGTALGFLQFRASGATLRSGILMIRRSRMISQWLVLDFAVNRWARQAVLFIVAGISGTTAVGAIQASSNLLGFTNVLILGWSSAALADGAAQARAHNDPAANAAVRRSASQLAIAMTVSCIIYSLAATWLVPAVYGHGFTSYVSVAPIVALQTYIAAMDLYPVTLLRIRRRTRRIFTSRALLTPVGFAAALVLAQFGVLGGALATVAMALALTVGAWLALASRTSRPRNLARLIRQPPR